MEKQKIYKLVLIRHGETSWNKEKKYTGWVDTDLTDRGVIEAKEAAMKLKEWKFDICYTSILKRTIKSWNTIADLTDQNYVTVQKTWRLNERHFGALQGLNSNGVIEKYGEDFERRIRKEYLRQPPAAEKRDKYSGIDKKYIKLPDIIPLTEVKFNHY
jgi:2,3-bisphosphoglycerate-dependent phosphoglycerate mutase